MHKIHYEIRQFKIQKHLKSRLFKGCRPTVVERSKASDFRLRSWMRSTVRISAGGKTIFPTQTRIHTVRIEERALVREETGVLRKHDAENIESFCVEGPE